VQEILSTLWGDAHLADAAGGAENGDLEPAVVLGSNLHRTRMSARATLQADTPTRRSDQRIPSSRPTQAVHRRSFKRARAHGLAWAVGVNM
jgi:hypothetical protein